MQLFEAHSSDLVAYVFYYWNAKLIGEKACSVLLQSCFRGHLLKV